MSKLNLKYILLNIVFIFSIIGCSTGGGIKELDDIASSNDALFGRVFDGPIYGAKVDIIDKSNGKIIATTTTSDDPAKLGYYSVPKLPYKPKEIIIKVSGGKDAGVDGEINDNDEDSFELKSVIDNLSDNTKVVVTPATTLITALVESNNSLSVDDAKKDIQDALGLDNDVDLLKTPDFRDKAHI